MHLLTFVNRIRPIPAMLSMASALPSAGPWHACPVRVRPAPFAPIDKVPIPRQQTTGRVRVLLVFCQTTSATKIHASSAPLVYRFQEADTCACVRSASTVISAIGVRVLAAEPFNLTSEQNTNWSECIAALDVVQPSFAGSVNGYSSYLSYLISIPIEHSFELSFKIIPSTLLQISLLAFIGQSGFHDERSDHLAVSFVQGMNIEIPLTKLGRHCNLLPTQTHRLHYGDLESGLGPAAHFHQAPGGRA